MTSTSDSCIIDIMTTDTKKRITLFVSASLARHARAQAVLEDLTLTELVEKALSKYLPEETVIRKTEV